MDTVDSTSTLAATHRVVVNAEEQYSVWSTALDLPAGWRDAAFSGSVEACLEHIARVWVDLRPASVRRALDTPG